MGTCEDRLSCLHDSILHTILSMMPLKSAVRTDVLSQRWRNLWNYSLSKATKLDFGQDFANNLSAKEFVETVNRYLLLNHSKKLESFHLYFCPFDLFASDIERWISFATRKGVEYLDINLSQGFRNPADGEFTDGRCPFELPSSLFDCNSLIGLSLSRCNFITPLNLTNFGGLKSLSISHSNINEEMLQSILTECSLLESLSLRSCHQLGSIIITVPDLKLKRLIIGDCWRTDLLEINAPKLQSFHYFGVVCMENNFLNISSLEDAAIYTMGRDVDLEYSDLLSQLSHVKILTICTASIAVLTVSEDGFLIELQNLKELQLLITETSEEYVSLFCTFFSTCPFPFIEKLFIQLPEHIEDPNEKYWVIDPLGRYDFTFGHLKVVKVTNFKDNSNEMRLVSFLLQKAAILETLVLVLPFAREGKGKVLRILRRRVLRLRKAAPNAQIILHEFGEDDGLNPTHVEIYDDYSSLPITPSNL